MTGSAGNGQTKIQALRAASKDLIDIIYNGRESLPNVHVSVLPYDVAVRLPNTIPNTSSWIQPPYRAAGNGQQPSRVQSNCQGNRTAVYYNNGFVSVRDADCPKNNINELTDDPPTTNATRFRIPHNNPGSQCQDRADANLVTMRFAMTQRSTIKSYLDTMRASGCTRINVGLQWAWMTLSPKWQGRWDPNRTDLPWALTTPRLNRTIVLMTDGWNTVYMGSNSLQSDDDNKTLQLCSKVRSEGINLYVVGLGSSGQIDQDLLRSCAGDPTRYFHAPTGEDLRRVFQAIGDDILFETMRLSK
jgi:hypothetical protein